MVFSLQLARYEQRLERSAATQQLNNTLNNTLNNSKTAKHAKLTTINLQLRMSSSGNYINFLVFGPCMFLCRIFAALYMAVAVYFVAEMLAGTKVLSGADMPYIFKKRLATLTRWLADSRSWNRPHNPRTVVTALETATTTDLSSFDDTFCTGGVSRGRRAEPATWLPRDACCAPPVRRQLWPDCDT